MLKHIFKIYVAAAAVIVGIGFGALVTMFSESPNPAEHHSRATTDSDPGVVDRRDSGEVAERENMSTGVGLESIRDSDCKVFEDRFERESDETGVSDESQRSTIESSFEELIEEMLDSSVSLQDRIVLAREVLASMELNERNRDLLFDALDRLAAERTADARTVVGFVLSASPSRDPKYILYGARRGTEDLFIAEKGEIVEVSGHLMSMILDGLEGGGPVIRSGLAHAMRMLTHERAVEVTFLLRVAMGDPSETVRRAAIFSLRTISFQESGREFRGEIERGAREIAAGDESAEVRAAARQLVDLIAKHD